MKKISFAVFLLLVTGIIFAGKVVRLPDVVNPDSITIHNGQFYVTESTTIYIYSLKDFKLQSKFGKKGEGPQEFIVYPGVAGLQILFHSDKMQIGSVGKISFFSFDGKFIKELRHTTSVWSSQYYPIENGNKFVGTGARQEGGKNLESINIYDSRLKKEKEINSYVVGKGGGKGKLLDRTIAIQTFDNKAFIVGSRDFVIDVFNVEGKKLYSIQHDYKNMDFTDKHKEEILDWYKVNPTTKQYYESIKSRLDFPTLFPSIRSFIIADKKIYVQTYKKKNQDTEFLIFDIKGKFLKTVWLPIIKTNPVEISQLFTIKNNKLYQLIEDEDEEVWDLNIVEIM